MAPAHGAEHSMRVLCRTGSWQQDARHTSNTTGEQGGNIAQHSPKSMMVTPTQTITRIALPQGTKLITLYKMNPRACTTANAHPDANANTRGEHADLVLFVHLLQSVQGVRQSFLVHESSGRHFCEVHVRVRNAVCVGNLLAIWHDGVSGGGVEQCNVLVLDNLGKLEQEVRLNAVQVGTRWCAV